MNIQKNVPLKDFSTMKLGGVAHEISEAKSIDEVIELTKHARENNLPFYILGGGSNTLIHDEGFAGIVILNRIPGFEIINETDQDATIKIGAGETWDDVVKKTTDLNLSGIECMSFIPGTAGAAPVQNIGAYGQEISDTLVSLEAYDTKTDTIVTLTNNDCEFSYRHSIFRGSEARRYIIVNITINLKKSAPKQPFYQAIQDYLDKNNIKEYTPSMLREIIINIRKNKLPDPKVLPNTGSFFKNAIVSKQIVDNITSEYPDAPIHKISDNQFKVPTGWLIEKTGLKGLEFNGMRVYEKNALVLINSSAKCFSDLLAARNHIISAVYDKFNITIEQEPLEMPIK